MQDTRGMLNKDSLRWCIVLMVLLEMFGCNIREVGVHDYLNYMNNKKNGLIQTKEVDGLVFEVRYLTPELMSLNELKTENVEKGKFRKTLKEYEGLNYYKIKISGNEEGKHVYNVLKDEGIDPIEVEAELNFDMQQNIYTVQGSDTGACVLYVFSKTYGLAKTYDMQIGVERKDSLNKNDAVVEINSGILKRGLLKFRFSNTDIQNIPLLKY